MLSGSGFIVLYQFERWSVDSGTWTAMNYLAVPPAENRS